MMVLYGTYQILPVANLLQPHPLYLQCPMSNIPRPIAVRLFTYKANRLARREDRFWQQWTLSRNGAMEHGDSYSGWWLTYPYILWKKKHMKRPTSIESQNISVGIYLSIFWGLLYDTIELARPHRLAREWNNSSSLAVFGLIWCKS